MKRVADLPIVQKALRRVQRHGLANTLHVVFVRLVNYVVPFKILRGVHVAKADPGYLDYPPAYTPSFLSSGELKSIVWPLKYRRVKPRCIRLIK